MGGRLALKNLQLSLGVRLMRTWAWASVVVPDGIYFFRQTISDVEADKIQRNRMGSGKPIVADPCGFRPG